MTPGLPAVTILYQRNCEAAVTKEPVKKFTMFYFLLHRPKENLLLAFVHPVFTVSVFRLRRRPEVWHQTSCQRRLGMSCLKCARPNLLSSRRWSDVRTWLATFSPLPPVIPDWHLHAFVETNWTGACFCCSSTMRSSCLRWILVKRHRSRSDGWTNILYHSLKIQLIVPKVKSLGSKKDIWLGRTDWHNSAKTTFWYVNLYHLSSQLTD